MLPGIAANFGGGQQGIQISWLGLADLLKICEGFGKALLKTQQSPPIDAGFEVIRLEC